MNFNIIRAAAAVPRLKVADTQYNISNHLSLIDSAVKGKARLILFPELSISGYSCADLFFQQKLMQGIESGIEAICRKSLESKIIISVGAPFLHQNKLFNCAFIIQCGKIVAIIPKTNLPGNREFYEPRWFTSAKDISNRIVSCCGQKCLLGRDIILNAGDFRFGVELCEDLWSPAPQSTQLSLAGAQIILNPSASNELVGKHDYRLQLISAQSGACHCGYLYSSCGVSESTTDLVFSGAAIAGFNGSITMESPRFERENSLHFAEFDISKLEHERLQNPGFKNSKIHTVQPFSSNSMTLSTGYETVDNQVDFHEVSLIQEINQIDKLMNKPFPHPFIPSDPQKLNSRCYEIVQIQAAGLAKRFEHTGCKCAVIGISGGLDSTLALLITIEAFKKLNINLEGILAVTMPGFGTTGRTYQNACKLVKGLKAQLMEISIKEASLQHFKDINHNPEIHDVTYENTQARERTQILMDLANKHRGMVIGTGDLSELALGWATYNGDHISMYGVNSGVPKTLVRHLVNWISNQDKFHTVKEVLEDILDTPVSPELIPADEKGEISQKTEEIVGPYELHDFFLYYMIRWGFSPARTLFYAENAFDKEYSRKVILKWLTTFYSRFFSQQFKRSCLPDGPKVGSINLSPRGDWRMPSDASSALWMKELSELKGST